MPSLNQGRQCSLQVKHFFLLSSPLVYFGENIYAQQIHCLRDAEFQVSGIRNLRYPDTNPPASPPQTLKQF